MKTWCRRYENENAPDQDIDLDRPAINFHSHHIFHDDKEDGRPDMFVTTQEGDLDCAGRKLRQGS